MKNYWKSTRTRTGGVAYDKRGAIGWRFLSWKESRRAYYRKQTFRHTYDPKNIGETEFKYNQVAQFRRMVFNVCAHNYDDHARNFSFICRDGQWTLAPAYDLTYDNTLNEHATTVNYKGLPTDEDLIAVGTNIRMTRIRCQQIIEEIREGTKQLTL